MQAFPALFPAPSIFDSSPLGAIVLSLFKLSALYPTASILTTSEIKVVSTPNGAEIKDSLTVEDEHGGASLNNCFFTP
jgi:hypothetical protein